MTLLESYLKHLTEGAGTVIGTSIAAVMGASAFTNAYSAYKERVREFGRTNKECVKKCMVRYDDHGMTKSEKKKVHYKRQECINTCNARFYKDVEIEKSRLEKIRKFKQTVVSKLRRNPMGL